MDDTLRPDYTYTIRFGHSLVDLHEANPIPDFHYVFSTGRTIDSMFLEGRIVKAVDYMPEDRVRLLFYAHRPDSFPFSEEPDYVSIADKEGRFRVLHIKEGCYYVYGVVDDNQDYRIDPVTEMMAYTDTCVPARKMVPAAESKPVDSLALADSLAQAAEMAETLADSLAWVAAYAAYDTEADTMARVDSLMSVVETEAASADTVWADEAPVPDTLSAEPPLGYHPCGTGFLTRAGEPGGGQCLAGSLTGAVASERVSEALKGSLRMDGNHSESAKAEGSLTATPTGGAGTKVGLSDPVV